MINIFVYFWLVPARIDPVDLVEKIRGSSFNLTCSVHGDADELTASWYYRLSSKNKWKLIDKPCVVPLALLMDNENSTNLGQSRINRTTSPYMTPSTLTDVSLLTTKQSIQTVTNPSLADCQSYATEGLESGILFKQASSFI